MLDAFSFYNLDRCQKNDVEIKGKGALVEVIFIKRNLYRNRQVISSVYLGPASNSGNKLMNIFF